MKQRRYNQSSIRWKLAATISPEQVALALTIVLVIAFLLLGPMRSVAA